MATGAANALAVPQTRRPDALSALAVPMIVNVCGRPATRENADLCGEYVNIGNHQQKPCYRKRGSRTVIRYWAAADRWLIDREGVQESDVCNAYAEQGGAKHPADEELVWCVWETAHRAHMRDPELAVTAAPKTLQVLGPGVRRENNAICGEYKLVGLHQGRVSYRKVGGQAAIRYWSHGDRWLIDLAGIRDSDVCNAYADARGATHPGPMPPLVWNVWDSSRNRHVVEPKMRALEAPRVIELVGRDSVKENSNMNGTYYLVALIGDRPAYQKIDGTGHAIRYWKKEDRWLIDLDGLREDCDVCNAFAECNGGAAHPGDASLEWHIWETSRGRHLVDSSVRTFGAPHKIVLAGRAPQRENYAMNGEYLIWKAIEGRPVYRKPDAGHVIKYRPEDDRWVVDLQPGAHSGDVANAYTDARGAEHPGCPDLRWHVWDSDEGRHVEDEDVVAEALEAPPPPAKEDERDSPSQKVSYTGGGC